MAEITVRVDDNSIIEIGQVPATNINIDVATPPIINTSIVGVGPRGRPGENGIGIPNGGTTGQIMIKNSDQDYDIVWSNFDPSQMHFNTTAEWNSQPTLIGEQGHIYVYTDYQIIDGNPVPGVKIGDGIAYLIDNPFVSGDTTALYEHINDTIVHITNAEREFWNNKVRCYMSDIDSERIIFTTE